MTQPRERCTIMTLNTTRVNVIMRIAVMLLITGLAGLLSLACASGGGPGKQVFMERALRICPLEEQGRFIVGTELPIEMIAIVSDRAIWADRPPVYLVNRFTDPACRTASRR